MFDEDSQNGNAGTVHPPMNRLKLICLNLIQRIKQVCLFPRTVGNARRRQAELNELEAERLDRIRNPSKYRGK